MVSSSESQKVNIYLHCGTAKAPYELGPVSEGTRPFFPPQNRGKGSEGSEGQKQENPHRYKVIVDF
jgi:hypothetical protein